MTDDNNDFDDLDFSDLGQPPKSEDILEAPVTKMAQVPQEVTDGYWVFQKPIAEVTHEEFLDWIQEKIPAARVKDFNKNVYNTTRDRERAVDKVIALYEQCKFPTQKLNKTR